MSPSSMLLLRGRPLIQYLRLQVFFKCSGEAFHRTVSQQVIVDPETGVRVVEAAVNITRNMIEQYFGKDQYQCQCVAWSSQGEIESQPAPVENACKYIVQLSNSSTPLPNSTYNIIAEVDLRNILLFWVISLLF